MCVMFTPYSANGAKVECNAPALSESSMSSESRGSLVVVESGDTSAPKLTDANSLLTHDQGWDSVS